MNNQEIKPTSARSITNKKTSASNELTDMETALELTESVNQEDETQFKSYKQIHEELRESTATDSAEQLKSKPIDKSEDFDHSRITTVFDRLTQQHLVIAGLDHDVIYADPDKEIFRCNLYHPKYEDQLKDIELKTDKTMRDEFKTHFKINFKNENRKLEFFEQFSEDIKTQNKYQDACHQNGLDESDQNPLLFSMDKKNDVILDENLTCKDCKNN